VKTQRTLLSIAVVIAAIVPLVAALHRPSDPLPVMGNLSNDDVRAIRMELNRTRWKAAYRAALKRDFPTCWGFATETLTSPSVHIEGGVDDAGALAAKPSASNASSRWTAR
jgi:hypothetical protein